MSLGFPWIITAHRKFSKGELALLTKRLHDPKRLQQKGGTFFTK